MQNLILLQCQITCIYFPHNSLPRSINSSTGLFPLARLSWVWAGPSPDFPSYVEREVSQTQPWQPLSWPAAGQLQPPAHSHCTASKCQVYLIWWNELHSARFFDSLPPLLSSLSKLTPSLLLHWTWYTEALPSFADRNTSWKWNELCFVYDRRGLSDILLLGMFLTCQSRTSLSLKWLL